MSERYRIQFGTQEIEFTLQRRARRSLAIHVHPDMQVEVVAPTGAPLEQVYEKVQLRAAWILEQVGFFAQFHPKTPPRLYVAGETHRYLGRQYRLKVVEGAPQGVKLTRGWLTVTSRSPGDPAVTQRLLEAWLQERAYRKFAERLELCLGRFESAETVRPTGLLVRALANRWGSMTAGGRLVLNRRLVGAPLPCIDYVIVHELCHRVHPHHGPAFWGLLEQVMPDWERWKRRLEETMV